MKSSACPEIDQEELEKVSAAARELEPWQRLTVVYTSPLPVDREHTAQRTHMPTHTPIYCQIRGEFVKLSQLTVLQLCALCRVPWRVGLRNQSS